MKTKVFVSLFLPDGTMLGSTTAEAEESSLGDKVYMAALCMSVAQSMKQPPPGLKNVHVAITTDRPPTQEELKRTLQKHGFDSIILS